jgi:hypothetical protein
VKPVAVETIVGQRLSWRPGHVRIALDDGYRRAYLLLYGASFPLDDVPALKDRDFDGRPITMSRNELAALNRRLQALRHVPDGGPPGTFRDQERSFTDTSRKTQFLS